MSGHALGWAKRQSAPCPASKALLVLLGDYADEDGFAWPSIARMAGEVQRSPRHVSRLLASLCDAGLLFGYVVSDAGTGRTRPRAYFFPVDGGPPAEASLRAYEGKVGGRVTRVSSSLPDAGKAPDPISINEGAGDTGVMGEGDTGVMGRVTRESSLELPLNPESPDGLSRGERASETDDRFGEALSAYPASGRGITNVPAAEEAWVAARTKAGGDVRLLAAVRAYAADPMLKRRDFGAPSFQRWLRESRWRAWLTEGEAQAGLPTWAGPDAVRDIAARVLGDGPMASYFDPARWDSERRLVVTPTRYAADQLTRRIGRDLHALGVGIEAEVRRE